MNGNEYRELKCRDIGNDCDFVIRAGRDEEMLQFAGGHLCQVHGICSFGSEFTDRIGSSVRSVWCQEQHCREIPNWGWG